jgi:hypothetical protein
VARVVSPVLLVHSIVEIRGSTPVENINFYTNYEPTTGCHVAAHDWATWHLNNQSKSAKCQMLIRPPVFHVPCQLSACAFATSLPCQPCHVSAMSACATCHPYSGDMCHPLTGPTVPITCSITCHMSSPGAATSSVWTVWTSPFFACLGFRTKRDIFRIQSPFDEINIWSESGRRDRHNGASFVRF